MTRLGDVRPVTNFSHVVAYPSAHDWTEDEESGRSDDHALMMKPIRSDSLRIFAWACLIASFTSLLVGWRLNNKGLYASVDGAYTKWNYDYAFQWGNWFDLSIFNPFSGLGSTFWTNTPWLNPGALALQLPFSPFALVTLSYLAQFAAYALTFYCLGRAAGASKLAIAYALGIFILLFLPPFNYFWGIHMYYPLAPFLFVTEAAANLILLSLTIAVRSKEDGLWFAKALAVGLVGLIWGIYASATYFVFDLVIVLGFFFLLLLCSIRQASTPRRLLLLASALLIVFVASGILGYLGALTSISAIGGPEFSDLIKGFDDLIFDEKVRRAFVSRALGSDGLLTFWCYRAGAEFSSCVSRPVGVLLLLSSVFCIYATITKNVVFRAMLLYQLLLQFGFWFSVTTSAIGLFPTFFSRFSMLLFATSSANTFVILPYMIVCDWLLRLVEQRQATSRSSSGGSRTVFSPLSGPRLTLWVMFALPSAAAVFIISSQPFGDPNAPRSMLKLPRSFMHAVMRGDYKWDTETPIVRHLRQQIGLSRGSDFRGVAATYLGNNSAIERVFGKKDRYYRGKQEDAAVFYRVILQNQYQNSGLWEFGIPTYDEYAHMITKALYYFTKELLTDQQRPFDYRVIRAYELNADILRVLGVRFVVSDAAIDSPDFTEVERFETSGDQSVELFLYRLDGANLANWSPIEAKVIKDNKTLINALKRDQRSLRDRVFLSSDPPRQLNDLVTMRRGRLSFDRNVFRFQGEADGGSLALLPLQFSHCWSQTGERPDPDVHLLRADYLLTGLLFKGTVDVRYKFVFGPWRSQCRAADAEMVR